MKTLTTIFVLGSAIIWFAGAVSNVTQKKWAAVAVGGIITIVGAICAAWLLVGPS